MDYLIANSRIRVRRNVVAHISRSIPVSKESTIRAAVGQEVRPEDVLGESKSTIGFRVIQIASELGVNPKEAKQYLKRQIGETVYQGELLASKEGMLGLKKSLVLCPNDGILESYNQNTAELQIRLLPHATKLVSGVYGVVDAVDKPSGTVLIRTMTSIVYGVVGSGKERGGPLKILGGADTLVSSKQIIDGLSGSIIVGGSLIFGDALQRAVSLGVSGIITGGINASDYRSMSAGGGWNIYQKRWSDVGLSLLATEGFGSIPLGKDLFPLLQAHEGKFAVLDGNLMRLILPTQEKEAIIYIRKARLPVKISHLDQNPVNAGAVLTQESSSYIEKEELKVGSYVRIVSGSYLGKQGLVESIDKAGTLLSTGIRTYMINVATHSKKIRIPYSNVEIACCW